MILLTFFYKEQETTFILFVIKILRCSDPTPNEITCYQYHVPKEFIKSITALVPRINNSVALIMASPNPDNDAASIFVQKSDKRERNLKSPDRGDSSRANSTVKQSKPAEIITVKDFFDFMKTAYQVYEHLEGNEDEAKINWEALTKLTVINHVIEPQERELLRNTAHTEQKPITSKSDTALEKKTSEIVLLEKRLSYNDIESN